MSELASLLCDDRVFFFQAEDGIRDGHVTGVQTCALPICPGRDTRSVRSPIVKLRGSRGAPRSEERRVGKSVDLGGRRIIKKKKERKKDTKLHTNKRIKLES